MTSAAPPRHLLTRRAWLAALAPPLAAQASGKGQMLPAGSKKFLDPATESEILRLTDPVYSSHLASPPARVLGRRSKTLIFSSNRSGSWQVWRLDFSTGQARQLTEVETLQPRSAGYTADERGVLIWDGPRLLSVNLGSLRETQLAELPGGAEAAGPAFCTEDGTSYFWLERRGGLSSVQRWRQPRGPAETVLDTPGEVVELKTNPRRATIAWRTAEGSLWAAAFDGTQRRPIAAPPGRVAQFFWSADGRAIVYLHLPAEKGKLNSIREIDLDSQTDRLVASTTQFVRFAPNGDGSVFVGASGSLASPHILLLLRATRREFTLCEHKTSVPADSWPAFSPNSQRIVFETDRQGNPAIFSIQVDKLVEETS